MVKEKLVRRKVNKHSSAVVMVFWVLVGTFIFILGQFFVPVIRDFFKGSLLFLLSFAIFFSLGVALVVLALKKGVEGGLKKFLLLTGASAAGFFIGVLLHNFFYGLGVVMHHIVLLRYLMEALHVVFFIAAIFICPLGFLIGMLGSAVLLIKQKRKALKEKWS